jgi:hypothetical protein
MGFPDKMLASLLLAAALWAVISLLFIWVRTRALGKIKTDQIKASGAKIVIAPCHNCIDQLMELNKKYALGVQINTKLRSDERNLVLGGGNRRPQNEAEICNQPKNRGKPTFPQSPTGRPWYPMQIGYQDIFETTGFPSFSKTLAYSVQCQLNVIWYKTVAEMLANAIV